MRGPRGIDAHGRRPGGNRRQSSSFAASSPICPIIDADATRLRQLFLNLLSNAIKFTPDGGRSRSPRCARRRISASPSATLASAWRPRIFPRRSSLSVRSTIRITRKYGGTGLGLPLSKLFAEGHGGRLAINSIQGSRHHRDGHPPGAGAATRALAPRPIYRKRPHDPFSPLPRPRARAFCAGRAAPPRAGSRIAPARKKLYLRPETRPSPTTTVLRRQGELGRMLFFDPILSGSGPHLRQLPQSGALLGQRAAARHRRRAEAPAAARRRCSTSPGSGSWLGGQIPRSRKRRLRADHVADDMDRKEADLIAALGHSRLSRRLCRGLPRRRDFAPPYRAGACHLRAHDRRGRAPFDRWIAGDETAITDAAKRGFDLFNGKAGCAQCHSGWNFTDGRFTISARARAPISAAAAFSPIRRSCATPSRSRRCATWRAARPICMMARCRRSPR